MRKPTVSKLVRLPPELAKEVAAFLHKAKTEGAEPRAELSENKFFVKAVRFYLQYRRTHDANQM